MLRSVGIVGCGWLGRALASRLIASGVHVVGTTGSPESAAHLAALGVESLVARFVPEGEGDLSRLHDVDAIVVAIPPSRGLDPLAQARAIARAVAATRAAHLVQISTTSVYPNAGGRVVEDDAIADHPLRRVEDSWHQDGRLVTILRCAGLYGPGRLILPYVLRAGVVVDENAPVNLVEQSDVVSAICRALESPAAGTFNLCADEHPTKGEFYRELAKRARLGVPRFDRTGEPWKVIDNRKFRERFAFRYEHPDPLKFPV
ncbi:MAG: NAD(P)-binding domain-containing protein [Thermoanaerobaculia bacterium]|nr:NAD(P)-binding domain-containing protein [Thermoanaerobaculia bacterium]